MKKFYAMAMALLALASCSNEELLNEGSIQGNVITATFEQGTPASRLAIDASSNTLRWTSGDAFVLFGESSSHPFTLKSGQESNSTATFTGTAPASIKGAAFPYKTDETNPSLNNGTLTMTLPATLDQTNSGVCNLPMWSSATTLENNIEFKHLAGLLKTVLKDIPSTYNQLVVTASNPISGEFTATTSDNEPVLKTDATASDANNTVTVSFTALSPGQTRTLYIPLPVGTYTSIKVSVNQNGNNPMELATYTNKTVARANVYTASLNYTESEVTTPAEVSNLLSSVTGTNAQVALTATIDATANNASAITIPTTLTNVSLGFSNAPTTSPEKPLKIESNASASSGTATQILNIDMADVESGSTGTYLEITTPTTTVSLNGGTYEKVTATTATNTLIIGEGVTIKELELKGGNLKLEGDLVLEKALWIKHNCEIDLNGHSIKRSLGGTIYVASSGTLTISGDKEGSLVESTYEQGAAIWNFAGTLIINSGTYKNSGNCAAIYCDRQDENNQRTGTWNLTIYGGTFISQNGTAVSLQNNRANENKQEYTAGLATINGGTFTGNGTNDDLNIANVNINIDAAKCIFTNSKVLLRTSGENVSGSTGTWGSVINGVEVPLNSYNNMYIYNVTANSEEQLRAATAFGGKVTLGTDIENLSSALWIRSNSCEIDLNGHSIKRSSGGVIYVASGKTLTISGDKEGSLVESTHEQGAAIWNFAGTLIINSGTYKNSGSCAAIFCDRQNDDNTRKGTWNLTINGGTFIGQNFTAVSLQNNRANEGKESYADGLATINGGTFTGSGNWHDLYLANVNAKISNGTFTRNNVFLVTSGTNIDGGTGTWSSYINNKEWKEASTGAANGQITID